MKKILLSWGNIHKFKNELSYPRYVEDINFNPNKKNYTFYGNGRSYGDVCLNNNGDLSNL